MGELAIAPSDTMQVWAGTGEEDSRNTISPGCGIFKSTDGGLTWKRDRASRRRGDRPHRRASDQSQHRLRRGAGQPWTANPERGLYKTTDGGQTWQLIKFICDQAGFVDVAMDPSNPEVLFAASWQRVRGPYFLNSGGPGSALWKTTDGGKTWTEVKGGGLPETTKGRIGLAIARLRPEGHLPDGRSRHDGQRERWRGQGPADAALRTVSLHRRRRDVGKDERHDVRPFYYSQVRVDPKNPNRVYWSSTPVNYSNDGGKTVGNATVGHPRRPSLRCGSIPTIPNHIIVGNDGGVAQTWDRGGNWDFLNTFAIGQFYNVSYDMDVPYSVCAGLQDNGSWCGPSAGARATSPTPTGSTIGGGDGFHTAQDPTDPNIDLRRVAGRQHVAAQPRDRRAHRRCRSRSGGRATRLYEDSIVIERPDTDQAARQRHRSAASPS